MGPSAHNYTDRTEDHAEVEGVVKSLWVRAKHLSLMWGCFSSQIGFGSVKTLSGRKLGQDQNLRVIPKSDKKITSRTPAVCVRSITQHSLSFTYTFSSSRAYY